MQFSKGCKINNYLFKRLGKVVISQKLLVFEVRNKKQTCCNINFEYSRGWKKMSIQNYRRARGEGAHFLIVAIFKKKVYFSFITSKTSNFKLIATFPNLLNKKLWILQPFENRNFPLKMLSRPFFHRFLRHKNSHQNQTDHNKNLNNSLKWPQHMAVKNKEALGSLKIQLLALE